MSTAAEIDRAFGLPVEERRVGLTMICKSVTRYGDGYSTRLEEHREDTRIWESAPRGTLILEGDRRPLFEPDKKYQVEITEVADGG